MIWWSQACICIHVWTIVLNCTTVVKTGSSAVCTPVFKPVSYSAQSVLKPVLSLQVNCTKTGFCVTCSAVANCCLSVEVEKLH